MSIESPKNPEAPIRKNDVFKPEEEVKQILKVPSNERAEVLKRFKEKLAYQKEQLAHMQRWVIDYIWAHPDCNAEKFKKVLDHAEEKYKLKLNEEQRDTTLKFFNEYEKRHESIEKIINDTEMEGHKDDIGDALYQKVFGKKPEGKVEIVKGPITLYFRCHDPKDYAVIYNQTFLGDKKDITEEEIKKANMSGGVSIKTSLVEDLRGAIIAENTGSVGKREDIRRHEEQHALKQMFGNRYLFETSKISARQETFERDLKRWLKIHRERRADERARDEILAFLKGGSSHASILEQLTKSEEKGGIYDYLSKDIEEKVKKLSSAEQIKKVLGDEKDSILRKIVTGVYVEDYKRILEDGLGATKDLKEKMGLSTDEIIALLIHEPLSRWKKVTDRLIKEKEIKELYE